MNKEELIPLGRFTKHAILVMVGVLILATLIVVASDDTDAYAKSLSYKMQLLEQTTGPRAVIVGGSGTTLGFDANTFERVTGLSTINTGVYAGLGMRFISKIIEAWVHEGDTVIVLPEYELLHQPPTGDGHLLLETLASNPSFIKDALHIRSVVVMTRAFPNWLRLRTLSIYRSLTKTSPHSIYALSNIEKNGDLRSSAHENLIISEAALAQASDNFVRPTANKKSLDTLTSFISLIESRGVQVFISLPPLPKSGYQSNKKAVESRYEELVALFGKRVLGKPSDFIYPASYFYDAPTHLNAKGELVRTQKIIEMYLQSQKNQ